MMMIGHLKVLLNLMPQLQRMRLRILLSMALMGLMSYMVFDWMTI